MKLVSYQHDSEERLGIFLNQKIFDLKDCALQIGIKLPSKIKKFLKKFHENLLVAKKVEEAITSGKIQKFYSEQEIKLLAPVPKPTSCRDGYAFRQHVATARRNRGVEMIQEFDQFPIFYFTNHNAIIGPGEVCVEEDHLKGLDFELEAAIVIAKEGKNISSQDADSYIAGYMIMNDFSARVLQMDEMKLNLGRQKEKILQLLLVRGLLHPMNLNHKKLKHNLEINTLLK